MLSILQCILNTSAKAFWTSLQINKKWSRS